MKELKEFTVERLKSLSQEPDVLSLHAYEIMALAKIALAAKQAKPIGEVRLSDYDSDGCRQGSVTCLHDQADWDNFPDGTKLYATPPLNHTEHHLDMVVHEGWINCSDRMPESSGEFSVYETINNRVQHDYWVPDDCAALGVGFWNHYGTNVTHWMPLPAAPKPDIKS